MDQGNEARQRFAAWLREVHTAAGAPSGDDLEKASLQAGDGRRPLSSSGVQRLLRARFVRPPDWRLVTAFLDTCAHCAPSSAPVPRALLDRDTWRTRYEQLVTLCEAAKGQARNRTGKEDEPAVTHALETYARRVRESYGRLDLEVLTPDNDQNVQQKVELREVFVVPTVRADPPPVELSRELMVKLLEGEELMSDGDLPPGLDLEMLDALVEAYRQRPAESVLDVLAREESRRVVLLGDPGAGKSTLAHYLALSLVGSPDPGEHLARLAGSVPLVVELRHYAQPAWRQKTFEEFLDHLSTTEGMALPRPVLQRLLAEGRALLVFDGLDEIFDPEFRAETARRIAGFAARHERCRVVVTSRVVGYQRRTLDGADFAHYMIQDLDTPRIHAFARRWFDTACPGQPAQAEQLFTRFKDAIAHSASVRELAGNPLLLTILAILGRRQTLPRDRHSVYQHAVTVLVARWDRDAKHLTTHLSGPVADALDVLGQVERLEMLRLLARRMQEGAGGISGNYIPEHDIEDVFRQYLQLCDIPPDVARRAARAMVQQLRERNFILARYGGGAWGFVHRTFLEYLAAADIVHRYEHEREWTPDALVHDVLLPRAEDTTWHEVILLLAGQLRERDTGTLVDGLVGPAPCPNRHERLTLALRALAEVKKIGVLAAQSVAVVEAIARHLGAGIGQYGGLTALDPLPRPADAAPAMASFSEHWVGRGSYLTWFHAWGQFLTGHTATQLACALHRDAAAIIAYARFAWEPSSRIAALSVLHERWQAPCVMEAIKTCAVHDERAAVRRAAVAALAVRPDDPERVTELRSFVEVRAAFDPAPGVRNEALNHLLHTYPDDRSRRFFEERAVHDAFDAVRDQAEQLARRLANRADPDHSGRAPRRRPLSSEMDSPYFVASSTGKGAELIVEAALTHWRSDSYGPLSEITGSHSLLPEEMALASWLKSHPEDLLMLMRDIRQFSNGKALLLPPPEKQSLEERYLTPAHVQQVALWAISLVRENETRDFLVECAHGLADVDARETAVLLLAENWSDDPSVMGLLLDIVVRDRAPDLRLRLIRELSLICGQDAAVRDTLYRMAVGDPDPAVRLFALRWMGQWWPDHPARASLFVTDAEGGAGITPRGRLARLQALVSGPDDGVWERQSSEETDPTIRAQMHRVRLLRDTPERAAHTVFHHRLSIGLRRLLRARRRAHSTPVQ
ncbi:NACHT domain-containing protein [Streptomyces sp. SS]|uniref:NACHT domain-containing protein n=1 Tax=Streptomyces sp. SS TaxID=260742 RepID=UPI00031D1CEC|nr:NACHT domain-containing protein [Streptomyces sp. SS]